MLLYFQKFRNTHCCCLLGANGSWVKGDYFKTFHFIPSSISKVQFPKAMNFITHVKLVNCFYFYGDWTGHRGHTGDFSCTEFTIQTFATVYVGGKKDRRQCILLQICTNCNFAVPWFSFSLSSKRKIKTQKKDLNQKMFIYSVDLCRYDSMSLGSFQKVNAKTYGIFHMIAIIYTLKCLIHYSL